MISVEVCTLAEMREYIAEYGSPVGYYLAAALTNPKVEVFKCLLEAGLKLNDRTSDEGLILNWQWTIQNKNPRVLAAALAAGADVNWPFPSHRHPLISAAHMSRVHCQLLIEAGMDIHTRLYGQAQMIHMAATMEPRTSIIEYLLQNGADPNSRDGDGYTPLLAYLRCRGTNTKIIDCFIRGGADIDAVDNSGRGAIYYALAEKTKTELFHLIVNGADVWNNPARAFAQSIMYQSGEDLCKTFAYFYMAGVSISDVSLQRDPEMHESARITELIDYCSGLVRDVSKRAQKLVDGFELECSAIIRYHNARITEVCAALQSLRLPALQLCEIVRAELWFWPRLRFHDIWNRVVAVRHFHDRRCR